MSVWSAAGRLTLDRALRSNADQFGDKSFIEWAGDIHSYGDVDRRISQVANTLRALGVERGQHVLVMMPNSADHVAILFGLHRAGCVYVACSTAYPLDEVRYQILHSNATAVITVPENAEMMSLIAKESARPIKVITAGAPGSDLDQVLQSAPHEWAERDPKPDELATIVYTSGTTARPKGVMWHHAQVYTSASRGRAALQYVHEDRVLHFLPLYHSNGAAQLASTAVVGASLVMEQKFSASRFSATLHEKDITLLALNATHVKMVMEQPPSDLDLAHPPARAQFGLYLEPERRAAFEARFGVRLVEIYGMTETAGLTSASPIWTLHSDDSCGLPLPGVQFRIVDEDGEDLPEGERGEILMRGESPEGMCAGYYEDPESTAKLFVDGWLHSGDVGYFDADGFLHFVERGKDMIKRAGYNVAAAEVERVVLEHQAVAEAAVVGIPDEMREEAIVAFVVPADSQDLLEPGEVLEFCAARLASYKQPQFVAIVDKLPENFLGKVEKKTLRETALELFKEADR